ncbi:Putative auto-transporter adhesin, head GIN domain [Hymenobacter daecheongensis DSM 21074]|uniref:Putative auto-transporter adhesin, head GIN domain n=1 Tax=Hymenobacter daecheongensis DSM 21074 TaxID=1121955 RepID=A0A1M6AGX4_9BACT|nr:head GIN domain-containing protein [Hymenobacter daecheongensis]SHI35631.1 Putative auto-transporter adhesin, head GIN domain [Hymenobacter daecheongensis DSM 21074]
MKTLPSCLLVCLLGFFTLISSRSVAASASREVRPVGTFTEVSLANSVLVVLVQGSPQKVEVEGDADDLAHLETTVRASRLRINTVREASQLMSYRFKSSVTVYVTAPILNALSVSGSGSMKAAAGVKAATLSLSLSGSGRLELGQVRADKLESSISGSGSIGLGKGSVAQHEISISGSGIIKAPNVTSEVCRVSISGSGDCYLNATRSLEASIVGSGDVYVTGNPKVSSSTVGSGRVHKS